MHTSTVLNASQFHYATIDPSGGHEASFDDFVPRYKDSDRLAVVCPFVDQAVLGASYAVLAMVTRFYDCQRAKCTRFFIYPQNFAIFHQGRNGFATRQGSVDVPLETCAAPFSNLDVWPSRQWVGVPPTANAILTALVEKRINRVLWPTGFQVVDVDEQLLRQVTNQLKWICFYGSDRADIANHPDTNFEIRVDAPVEEMVQGSIGAIPMPDGFDRADCVSDRGARLDDDGRYVEQYRIVSGTEFASLLTTQHD